jgi:ABC-2 type transport system ATP-binding protein
MLDVQGIGRSYGSHRVVDDVTFTVQRGSILAVLGPNGCGKSTTMKVLAGAIPADAGRYWVDGEPGGSDHARQSTGYVPDTRGVFPRLTGREHLALAARLHRATVSEQVLDALIDRLGLDEVVELPAAAYSHGQSRRLSMAMALVADPPLLLVDEPFDGVDPEGVDTITGLLLEARDRGRAVLLTTHLLDAAVVADEIAVFRGHTLVGPHPTGDLLREHGTLGEAWRTLSADR